MASRVFPTPPGPASVTSRISPRANSCAVAEHSASRPMVRVSGAGTRAGAGGVPRASSLPGTGVGGDAGADSPAATFSCDTARSSNTFSGRDRPRSGCRPSSASSAPAGRRSRTISAVACESTMVPPRARLRSLAARLSAGPKKSPARSCASPVWTATRTRSSSPPGHAAPCELALELDRARHRVGGAREHRQCRIAFTLGL